MNNISARLTQALQLLESVLQRQEISRPLLLKLPGFLGLGATVSATDLMATIPRHIGETLARGGDPLRARWATVALPLS